MISEVGPDRIQEVPSLPSPYGDGPIPTYRHLKLSAFWFATNFLWGAMMEIMLPNELRHMTPHVHIVALGFITGSSALVAVIVPLVAGSFSDRCTHHLGRRRPFIITGVGINLVGLFLMWFAYHTAGVVPINLGREPDTWEAIKNLLSSSGFLFFVAAYMIVQLGNNIASAAYTGLIPDLVPPNQRGAASGYMAIMSQVGTVLGIVTVGILLGHSGEAVKYFSIATMLAAIGLLTVMGIQETRLTVKPPPMNWKNYIRSLWIDPKLHPDFFWVWVTRFFVMLGFYSIVPFINDYLYDVIGMVHPDVPASELSGAILIFASISGFLGGVISDRIGRKKVVTIANIWMAVVGLGFIFCRNFVEALIVGIVFGLGYGAYISVDWALGADVLPSKDDAAKGMAVWHIAMTLPQSIAAPVAGLVIASFGRKVVYLGDEPTVHYTIAGYASVFIMVAACFGLGAALLRNVRGVK
jgi:MFS family permease